MLALATFLLMFLGVAATPAASPLRTVHVYPPDLEAAVDSVFAADGELRDLTFRLAPGTYHLRPGTFTDPTCGNCREAATPVPATVGLRVAGRNVVIVGAGARATFLRTGAGYGLLFEDCDDCALRDLTVTGGMRDDDGRATDAAVVVRRSSVSLERCRLADNLGAADLLRRNTVGIMGVCGREGARLTIADCDIVRNSWDGIALYRDAQAAIRDCIVDGIDAAGAAQRGGGRGVGIGVTWNAHADIRGNLVRRYWKGIGVFVDGEAVVARNIVEDVLTWGITVWDADQGRPRAEVVENLVHGTGACGIAITLPADIAGGRCTGNLIAATGQNEKYDSPDDYCAQCPIAVHAAPPGYVVADNLCVENRRALPDSVRHMDVCDDTDLASFLAAVDSLGFAGTRAGEHSHALGRLQSDLGHE